MKAAEAPLSGGGSAAGFVVSISSLSANVEPNPYPGFVDFGLCNWVRSMFPDHLRFDEFAKRTLNPSLPEVTEVGR